MAAICSADPDGSRELYEMVVGLRRPPDTIKNHLLFDCADGTTLLVYGRGAPCIADHTHVRFWSDDVEADVRELSQRGVVFDELDLGAIKTVNGVATVPRIGRSAWFKDPDDTLARFEPALLGG